MLGAVMMHLQRQGRSRLHLQALHLEARAIIDTVVAAPGTENLAMQGVLVATLLLESEDELLHILHPLCRRYEDRILGLEDHMVLQAHYRYEPALRIQIAAPGILGNNITPGHIAPPVRFGRRVKRRPRAYVAPPCIQRNHHRVRGPFHYRIINGIGRAGFEHVRIDTREIEIAFRAGKCTGTHLRHFGSEPLELLQIATRPKHEHATVPVILAGAHELRRLLGIGLLDEAGYAMHALAAWPGLAPLTSLNPLYIAVACLRRAGDDSKGDQLPLLRRRQRNPDSLLERGNIPDNVIGR